MKSKAVFKNFVRSKLFTLLIVLVILVVVLAVTTKGSFIAMTNIGQILDQMFVSSVLTIGAGMLIISGAIDLSSGVLGTFSGLMLAFLLNQMSWPWYLAFIVTLVVATGFGVFNAIMINELRFHGFIATLATASIVQGLMFVFSGGATIGVPSGVITKIGTAMLGPVPLSIVLLIVAFVLYGFIVSKSKFGRQMYIVGGNPQAARLAGVNPKKVSYILFANSAILSCLAGVFLAARVSSATATGTTSSQFYGITAAILGGISFGGGTGNMGGAFVGLLILTAFTNGMVILGFDAYWRQIVNGLLLILALTFDYISIRRTSKKMAL